MSKIILNGIEYSNGIIYQELQPVIYSDEEREIGVWRDGKPLYQKTIDVGMLPNRATKTVNYDVANVDAIVKIFGIGIATTGGCCPIPFSDDYSSAGNILLDANTSSGTIRLISQSDKSPFHGYITIQYTKTTDVAGSGTWTPSGVKAVHYSTNEQVIGTYFGKTLYEKGFNVGTQSFSSGQITITNDLSNIDEIVEWGGSAKEPRDNRNIPIPYMRKTWNECVNLQVVQLSNGTVSTAIVTNDSWYTSLENIKIWIRYTKTSD